MNVKKCERCGKKIPSAVAYLPGIGEVCLNCYGNFVLEQETSGNIAIPIQK